MLTRSASILLAIGALWGGYTHAKQSTALTGNAEASSTQSPTIDTQSLDQRFSSLLGKGRYVAAINLIEQADPAEISEPLKSTYRQVRPALDGFVVAADTASMPAVSTTIDTERYDGAAAEDAIAQIVERAKQTRVVIINETHDNPRDRAFILSVAEALRPLGYTVYAAEGFTNWINPEGKPLPQLERLIADGYPRYDTGFYMMDPMFGHLVRRALSLGYRPLPYEYSPPVESMAAYISAPMAQRVALRERGQAENLARAITEAEPDAKFLVHVGYSHAAERPIGPEGNQQEWMAAQLAKLTGIDPLTIDQTHLSEYQPSAQVRELYAKLAPSVGNSPKVFLKNGRPVASGTLGEATDLQVVHPRIGTVGGRPDWLQGTGRKAIAIPAELLPKEGRRLVQAFNAAEAEDAVPLDQVLLTAGKEAPIIYVPAESEIRWAVQDN